MSQIRNTEIEGDVAVGRHVTTGGNAIVRGTATVKKNLRVEGWLDAKNIKASNKGVFLTEEDLKSSYPTPHPGWWALVGDTLPAPLYLSRGGQWIATGKSCGTAIVDMQKYTDEVTALRQELLSLTAELRGQLGQPGGIATLDDDGFVEKGQLKSPIEVKDEEELKQMGDDGLLEMDRMYYIVEDDS